MWEFTGPRTIIFGKESLEYLKEIKGERALVITDKVIRRLGFVDKIANYLREGGISIRVFDEVEPDPSTETVSKAARIAMDYNPDWIVALGGGSSIDVAKATWVLYERPDIKVDEISPLVDLGLRKKARLICIPTTSGSGSDASWAIVVTNTKEQRKMELASKEIFADICILEPQLTSTMPPELIADTGIDALANGIEAYVSQWRNDFSDALSIKAIQLVFEYLPKAYKNPQDEIAREKMQNAATMAGLAFSNSQLGVVHATAHAIGGLFKIPHGRAIATVLPWVMEYNAMEAMERYAEIAKAIGIQARTQRQAVENLIKATRKLIEEMGEPASIEEMGMSWEEYKKSLEKLVERAMESTGTIADPRAPSKEDFRRLFTYAFKGRRVDLQ